MSAGQVGDKGVLSQQPAMGQQEQIKTFLLFLPFRGACLGLPPLYAGDEFFFVCS